MAQSKGNSGSRSSQGQDKQKMSAGKNEPTSAASRNRSQRGANMGGGDARTQGKNQGSIK